MSSPVWTNLCAIVLLASWPHLDGIEPLGLMSCSHTRCIAPESSKQHVPALLDCGLIIVAWGTASTTICHVHREKNPDLNFSWICIYPASSTCRGGQQADLTSFRWQPKPRSCVLNLITASSQQNKKAFRSLPLGLDSLKYLACLLAQRAAGDCDPQLL